MFYHMQFDCSKQFTACLDSVSGIVYNIFNFNLFKKICVTVRAEESDLQRVSNEAVGSRFDVQHFNDNVVTSSLITNINM